MKLFSFGLAAMLVIGFLQHASANEIRRLEKCYAIMVRERILKTDPLYVQVKSGALSGTAACMKVFDSAKLDASGKISQQGGIFDRVGSRVLSSFLEFHRSHFTISEYYAKFTGSNFKTTDVIDANEPAYHYLYSLFAPNQSFSNIVTRNNSFQGLRFSAFPNRTRMVTNINSGLSFMQGNHNIDQDNNVTLAGFPWSPLLVQTGTLIGVAPETRQNIVSHPPNRYAFTLNRNVNEHFGGGLLGTQVYLAGNLAKNGNMTGGVQTQRIWAKNMMSDLLCRTLPALRSSDVLSFVNMASTHSFRKGISCQQCHATQDQIAGGVRQFKIAYPLEINGVGNGVQYETPVDGAGTAASAPLPVTGEDSQFSKRPPEGKLFYRGFDGNLVDVSFTGLQGLGQALAQTNDLYVCAAKRYYKFFTGIDANLEDLSNPTRPMALSAGEFNVRNKVVRLGQQLKSQQSARALIESIIASPEFVNPSNGVN